MSAGKTISFEKARADFGAVLRLAERCGSVKIMHGSRLLGEVISAARSQRLAEIEPLPARHTTGRELADRMRNHDAEALAFLAETILAGQDEAPLADTAMLRLPAPEINDATPSPSKPPKRAKKKPGK